MIIVVHVFLLHMMVDGRGAEICSDNQDNPAVDPHSHEEPPPDHQESSYYEELRITQINDIKMIVIGDIANGLDLK